MENNQLSWLQLNQEEQLQTLVEQSYQKKQLIFKHSTRCSLSEAVLNQFTQQYNQSLPIDLHYLDLISYREISNAITEKFQIEHQSPQVLIIDQGMVIHHASHSNIMELDLFCVC